MSGFDGAAGLTCPRGEGWHVRDPPEDKRTTCVYSTSLKGLTGRAGTIPVKAHYVLLFSARTVNHRPLSQWEPWENLSV